MMTEEKKIRFKRVSISTKGNTMTVTQMAASLSQAIDQELQYYDGRNLVLAQVNISDDGYFDD